jgi:ABC-type lipoprotein export system ATPase subunit
LAALNGAGTTVLVITHNPAVAGCARRRIIIRDGQLLEQASPQRPSRERSHDALPMG